MGEKVKILNDEGTAESAILNTTPDRCPVCGKHGQPNFVTGVVSRVKPQWQVYGIFRCPVTSCRALYLAIYRASGPVHSLSAELLKTALARYTETKEFPKNISDLSPDFCDIYYQALVAEDNGLDQVCGPGYRKALEFLVKDFLIKGRFKEDPTKQEEVKKLFLAPVIKNFVDEERIKRCAERATWLGNDHTHYLRKWVGKDISDLKSLILITVSHIDSVIEADRYLSEMPAPAKS
ncbi:MAG TPA: hypothetical protein VJA21_08360 [Verrucomicrobiae bacterium]